MFSGNLLRNTQTARTRYGERFAPLALLLAGDRAGGQNRWGQAHVPGGIVLSTARRLTDQAVSRLRERNWDEARNLLARAEAAGPRGSAWLQIALGQMELGDTPAARRALSAAEADMVSNPALHLFRALLCCDLGEWELARKDWWAARNLSPGNQAVPTVQALRYLGEGRLEEALKLLCPEGTGKVFDLTVSPPALGRLVVALEKHLLPRELPESLEAEASPPEREPPVGAAWLLMRRGRKRLEAAWALPIDERASEMRQALAELRAAREQDPKAFRASYYLGEALLSVAEHDRDRDQRPGPRTVAWVTQAQECFEDSRRTDGTNPYVLHYLARCALLLRRFERAQGLWREALDGFEKFPEAHYGLGQALLARGREREARAFLLSAILSDLHLLRDRIRELARLFRARPDLFAEPATFPLWEAPADPPPGAEKAADTPEEPATPSQSSDPGGDRPTAEPSAPPAAEPGSEAPVPPTQIPGGASSRPVSPPDGPAQAPPSAEPAGTSPEPPQSPPESPPGS